MSAAPTRTEAELRAALAAAVPDDTHVETGLEDLRLRLDRSVAPAPVGGRRDRRWVLAAAAVVVVALGAAGAAVLRPDDLAPPASAPSVTTTVAPAPNDPSRPSAASLTFHPVLAVAECSNDPDVARPDDVVPDPDFETCYQVGPQGADGTDLARAEVVHDLDWMVEVRARDESVEAFNSLFNACYDGSAACPPQSGDGRGAVAIVFEGHVISAPSVNGADLGSDGFTLSGDLTQAEAEALAAAIDAG